MTEEAKEPELEEVIAEVIDVVDGPTGDDIEETGTELEQKLAQAEQAQQESFERMLRIQAEFDNFKKRTQREKEAASKYKAQDIVTELLPAIDNFNRALQVEVSEEAKSFVDGMVIVYNQLEEALKASGVTEIETVGAEFDPNLHHAVMQEDDDSKPENTVIEELQKGYLLKDRVVRPAMVKVNK